MWPQPRAGSFNLNSLIDLERNCARFEYVKKKCDHSLRARVNKYLEI